MKKALLLSALLMWTIHIFSQSDIAGPGIGHQRVPGRYVGWSPLPPGSVAGSLEVRNDFPGQPIFFLQTT